VPVAVKEGAAGSVTSIAAANNSGGIISSILKSGGRGKSSGRKSFWETVGSEEVVQRRIKLYVKVLLGAAVPIFGEHRTL
jgi:hypothetical protein